MPTGKKAGWLWDRGKRELLFIVYPSMPFNLVPWNVLPIENVYKIFKYIKGHWSNKNFSCDCVTHFLKYVLQMCILKFLLKINLNIVVLRQYPVPNEGTKPKNTGLVSLRVCFLGLGFSIVRNTCYRVCLDFSDLLCSVGPNGNYFQIRISSINCSLNLM